MPNKKHTPTPWRMKMTSADWRLILSPDGQAITFPHNEADAALIVRAVNSHAALIEALENLFEHCVMTHKHWGEGSNQREADAAVKNAQAALKLAKES